METYISPTNATLEEARVDRMKTERAAVLSRRRARGASGCSEAGSAISLPRCKGRNL